MKAWTLDSAMIFDEKIELSTKDIITTTEIELFLKNKNLAFIIAPKGFGKTLLLTYKRMLLDNSNELEGVVFIPKGGLLIDRLKGGFANLDIGANVIKYLSDRRNWDNLWLASLSVAIIKEVLAFEEYKIIYNNIRNSKIGTTTSSSKIELVELLVDSPFETPIEIMTYILATFSVPQMRKLASEQLLVSIFLSRIHRPIAIFIDNIDDVLSEHVEKGDKIISPSIRGLFNLKLWYFIQQSLMFCATTLVRSNHHIKIFLSIRNEAFERIDSPLLENMRGHCYSKVFYSYEKLRDIFYLNINNTEDRYLAKAEEKYSNPLIALTGIDTIKKDEGESENLFEYIYRHTLKRPRDIINMGFNLLGIDDKNGDQKVVAHTVNETATKIAKDYIDIMLVHTSIEDKSILFEHLKFIPHNILNTMSIKRICKKINTCDDMLNCKECNKQHFFCDLFRIGLLGIVKYDTDSRQYKQHFATPGEIPYDDKHPLIVYENDKKNFYLIHPILNELIGGDPETKVNHSIIIGDKRDWATPVLPRFLLKYKTFLSHSSDDKKIADRIAKSLRELQIPFWYDKENIRVGHKILQEIDRGLNDCEYLCIIISKSSLDSGWVDAELGKFAIEELEKKEIRVLPVLLHDVWDRAPFYLKGKRYADFRKNYNHGFKELSDILCQGE